MKKPTAAQMDRDLASVLEAGKPAWQRGLDMTESRRLEKVLKTDPDLIRRKEAAAIRTINIRLTMNEGPSRTSSLPRGIRVHVSSPGVAYGNVHRVVAALRAGGVTVDAIEPRYILVGVPEKTDLNAVRAEVEAALPAPWYSVK